MRTLLSLRTHPFKIRFIPVNAVITHEQELSLQKVSLSLKMCTLVFTALARCSVVLHVFTVLGVSEKLILKQDPSLYHHINQGCLKVEGMDEKEQMKEVDVGSMCKHCSRFSVKFPYVHITLTKPFVAPVLN